MTEEEIEVKESKPYTRKGTYVQGYFKKGRKNVVNEPHTRQPRRTKEEIEKYGTRKEEKKRLRQFKQKVPETTQKKLAPPKKKKRKTKKKIVPKKKQKKINEK